MLYLVPPAWKFKDITLRSIEVLQSVDVILCEDTRTSSKLLQHYNIHKPLSPYHTTSTRYYHILPTSLAPAKQWR